MQRTFNEVVRSISRAEKDVDKVLHAARLQRHERMSDQQLDMIMSYVIGIILILACSGMFGMMYWIIGGRG